MKILYESCGYKFSGEKFFFCLGHEIFPCHVGDLNSNLLSHVGLWGSSFITDYGWALLGIHLTRKVYTSYHFVW